MINTIGIVGFGQMGRIFADIFSERFDVFVFNRSPVVLDAKTLKVKVVTLKETCRTDIVVFCVPIQNLEQSLKDASHFLRVGAIVLDIASVKEKPAKLMKSILPKNVELLGTHPMFGPNSLRESGEKNIVFCPIRIRSQKLLEVEKLFQKEGFTIFRMSPEEHDQRIANSQFFVHLSAHMAKKLKIKNLPFAPYSFKLMLKAFKIADSNPVFLKEIVIKNRFSKEIIIKMMIELSKLKRQLPKN